MPGGFIGAGDALESAEQVAQPDGIHPLAPGYKIVTRTVFQYLEPMLKKN